MPEYVSKIQSAEMDALFAAILRLRTPEECYRFFEDVCTISELQSVAQRWQVARLLEQGLTYQEIAQRFNASSATISRVNRCLYYGAGGYRLLLEREKNEQSEAD